MLAGMRRADSVTGYARPTITSYLRFTATRFSLLQPPIKHYGRGYQSRATTFFAKSTLAINSCIAASRPGDLILRT